MTVADLAAAVTEPDWPVSNAPQVVQPLSDQVLDPDSLGMRRAV